MLSELIARVETATEGSRELDALIMEISYNRDRRHIGCTCWDDATGTCCRGARHLDEVWVDPQTDKWVTTAVEGFEFTSSIDRVLALAHRHGFYINSAPRFHIDGERVDFVSHALRPHWANWRPDDEWFDRGEGRHADQVLSALIALLRALQTAQKGTADAVR